MRTICRTFICSKTIGRVSTPEQFKTQPNRAADGAKNTFEFYEHAELGLNAESVPDALPGYWTRVLARVKLLSEAVRAKETPEGVNGRRLVAVRKIILRGLKKD
jgi:hypothetical protein